ncbi:MAG: hypothetical protein DRR42_23700 [Gammaproteobacteria bacterium]|nr:MAG: hypothetical protein DRR42_23700 [Gammaproteobacteria bacterium]
MPLGKLVIVAGMHRAGTSAITGVLEGLGVRLGDSLAEAQEGINDMGYKEDNDVISLHEDLLWNLPSAWDDIFLVSYAKAAQPKLFEAQKRIDSILANYLRKGPLCAVKDPRICLFLPLWLDACERLDIEPLVLIPSRHPQAVAQSLYTRDGIFDGRAKLLWIKYFLAVERCSRTTPRRFLSYERLLESPEDVIEELICFLDVSVSIEDREKARDFLSPSLNRSQKLVHKSQQLDWINECSVFLYQCMKQRATLTDEEFESRFERVEQKYATYLKNIDPIMTDQCKYNMAHAENFRQYWQDALNSKTFKIIEPLRRIFSKR